MTTYSPAAKTERWMATCLALVAGYLDGYGLLALGTYVSFMSGNTTMTGVRAGQNHLGAALPAAIAIVSFVLGSLLGNLVIQSKSRHSHRVLFTLIALLIATVAITTLHYDSKTVFAIAFLSIGMGMLNPAMSKVGLEPVSLTFMTGTLSRIGGHLSSAIRRDPLPDPQGDGDSHLGRAFLDSSVWFSFLVGALLAGFLVTRFAVWSLFLPCLVLLALGALSSPAKKGS